MDLGLTSRRAFVAGSSQGIGYACAAALADEGVDIVLNGRSADRLEAAAQQLRVAHPDVRIDTARADLTAADDRDSLFLRHPEIDILVSNTAGPPPGGLSSWDPGAISATTEALTIPAVELMRAWVPGMRARRFGRVVHITSAMVKSPQYQLALSAAARAGLTAVSKALSRETARDNVTINTLLPGGIDSPRQQFMIDRLAEREGLDRAEARKRTEAASPAGRLGRLEEIAAVCAFLCSVQAGYLTAQNLLLDGGNYQGLL